MNFFKRIWAWSSRRKGKSKKKGRYRNGDGDRGISMLAHRESTSDALSWPPPNTPIKLDVRRTTRSYDISPSAQTPNNTIGSQERSNPRPTSDVRRSEDAFDIAATGSPNHTPPVSAIALNQQLVDDGLAGGIALEPENSTNQPPTYNVTVHRKKVHAVTRFPSTSVHQNSTRSSLGISIASNFKPRESYTARVSTPSLLQHQPETAPDLLKGSRPLLALGNDPELLQALQLYYSKDPAKMFKNSPLHPDFGPRSASEGDFNHCSTSIRAPRSKSLDIPASRAPDENSENASLLAPILQTAAPVVPLNIQSKNNNGTRNTTDASPRRVFLPVNTEDLRLSSPLLFDILFSNPLASFNNPDAPSKEITSITQAPSSVRPPGPESPIFYNSTPLDPDEDKENRPPYAPHYNRVSSDLLPDALPSLNETESVENPYRQDIFPAAPHRSHGPVFDNLQIPLSKNYSLRMAPQSDVFTPPANTQPANYSPTKSSRSLAGSEIVDAYANMTACGTDSEEEELIHNAVISTWQSARLPSDVHSSPSDLFSPSSTLSPFSPASMSGLETPPVSSDRRHMSWSPESRISPLTREDVNAAVHIQREPYDAELFLRSSPDNDTILEPCVPASPRLSPPPRPRNYRIFRPHSVSIDPSQYPSPHRGIVGLDGGSNREAFLYGAEDDETFARKLDLRMASVDDRESTPHEERLTPPHTPRVTHTVVRYSTPLNDTIERRQRYDAPTSPFSPAASIHVDGEVEMQRPRSRRKRPGTQSFCDKLGLSPTRRQHDESAPVDVFGTLKHSHEGNCSPHRHQIPHPPLRSISPTAGSTPSRISHSGSSPLAVAATRSYASPSRPFPRPKTGSRGLRPGDRMAFGTRTIPESSR